MFKLSTQQITQMRASLDEGVEKQQAVFDCLNYSPYDDDDKDQFGGTYHSVVMPFSQYQNAKDEIAQYPEDYGICDGERAAEISAGAKFTEQEWQLIDEAIFSDEDTYLVIDKFSDDKDTIYGLKVHQSQGQGGIHVVDFLGFYNTEEEAEAAILHSGYYVYEPFDG